MKPADVISTLQARGITLWQEAGKLRYRAPVGALTEREKAALKAHKAGILKALSQSTANADTAAVAPALAITEALQRRPESSEPAPKDRFCYQCQHSDRSPFGYPLGLCLEHGMPEGLLSQKRGGRIQHATSQPAKFGCISWTLRAPDTNVCTACRNYNPLSTMCRVANLGCPLPHIPPCRGESFEPNEVRS